MANQHMKNKANTKRKADTPATEPPAKRARNEKDNDEEEQGKKVEVQAQPVDSVQDDDEEPEPQQQQAPATVQNRIASKKTKESGTRGQQMFEDIEIAAASGQALSRGARKRKPPQSYYEGEEPADKGASRSGNKSGSAGKGKAAENSATKDKQPASDSNEGSVKETNKGSVKQKKDRWDRPPARDKLRNQEVQAPNLKKGIAIRRILAERNVGEDVYYFVD